MSLNRVYKKEIQHGIIKCDPIPSKEELVEYYSNKYYQQGLQHYELNYNKEEIDHKKYESNLMLQLMSNYMDKEKKNEHYKVLELGCGEGFFLSQAHKAGMDVIGVDYSEFGIKKWNSEVSNYFIQDDIYNFLERAEYKNKFHFCAMKNVLEYVVDPLEMLNKAKSLLVRGGKLIITVPNDYSKMQSELLKSKDLTEASFFSPPDHLYYFNTENFVPYVGNLGFKVLDMYSSFPIELFLLNKHSNYVLDKSKGKAAHLSRIKFDLLIKETGLDKALDLYRSFARCGVGRNFTALLSCDI